MRQHDFAERFAESEAVESAARAENRAYLIGALARVRASSDLRIFVSAVYNHAGDSVGKRWWSVTIRQLCGVDSAAATLIDPLTEVLGCSYGQAKRVAGRGRSLGLVRIRPRHGIESRDSDPDRQPGQQWEYQIDWVGVRRLVGLDRVSERNQEAPARAQAEPARAQAEPARAQAEPARAQAEPARAQAEPAEISPYKEHTGTGTGPCFERNTRYGTGTGAGASRPRLLDSVTLGTLANAAELLDVFGAVCELAPISGLAWCDADRLFVLRAAECAVRVERERRNTRDPLKSPVAFWRWMVAGGHRDKPSAGDGDRAAKAYEAWQAKQRAAESEASETRVASERRLAGCPT
jgi:hypothetical protein